ncbi:unnamed protein product [Cyclocybe aegerita]|uniref:Uncharacterized protein n=1 Tax=Cyclocybe aegerita TaxID=1973307 RepID=A0A8S0VR02_CYCAE|nr:unnamed protein product [Cyclocybe aegerita]
MRHGSLPTNLVMVPNPPETMGEKSTAISMDLSAREKIVIRHRLGAKNPTLPVKQQTLSRTVSIFKRKQEPKPEACPSVEGTSGSQDPGFTMIAKSPQSPHPIIRPSKKGILLKGPRIEKRVKRKSVTQSTKSSPRSPLSREIKITTTLYGLINLAHHNMRQNMRDVDAHPMAVLHVGDAS